MKFLSSLVVVALLFFTTGVTAQEPMQKGQVLPSGTLPTTSPVTAVAFSPDSSILAGAMTGRISLWNTATGQPLPDLTGFTSTVTCMAFSPDNSALVTGSLWGDGAVQVWDVGASTLRTTINHGAPVTAVNFAPNGSFIATAGTDKIIRIWNTIGGTQRTALGDLQYAPTAIQWIPNTRFFQAAGGGASKPTTTDAVVETQGQYTVFNVGQEEIVYQAIIPGGSQFCAFSSDGKRLAMAGMSARGTKKDGVESVEWNTDHLLLWRTGMSPQDTGEMRSPMPLPNKVTSTGLKSLAWSNDGRLLAWSTPTHVSSLTLSDTNTAPVVLQPDKKAGGNEPAINGFGCVAFSSDGRFLIAGDANPAADAAHGVQIWGIVQ